MLEVRRLRILNHNKDLTEIEPIVVSFQAIFVSLNRQFTRYE